MKKLTLFVLLLTLISCQSVEKSYDELLLPYYQPKHAVGFELFHLQGMKSTVIRITNPWQGAEGIVMDTFVQRDEEQPPKGFMGQVVPAGATRIVALSTTNIGMLACLGEEKRVVGVSGLQYVCNEYLTNPKNGVKDLGEEMQYETLVSLEPSLVICYGVSSAQQQMTDKLTELGIPYIYSSAYLEHSALGKSEWLVMYAELLDQFDKGVEKLEEIERNYNEAKALVDALPIEDRPTVMLNAPFNDAWVLPPVKSVTAELIRDAGAVPYTGKEEEGSVTQIGMEEAFAMLREADYWVGLGQMVKQYSDLPPALRAHRKDMKPVQLDHLYNNNAQMTEGGGSNYYEEGIVRPDIILRDLIEIFHPELQEHTLYFYRHVPVE